MVTEGGWSSTTVSGTVTSPAIQRQYIEGDLRVARA